ncbi:MAG: hypothetical protein V2I54_14315 [Bacteroidales bacterium]|jgi:hypothetical protein|nr:hypothetical protein [Bacteroidales bacterium]
MKKIFSSLLTILFSGVILAQNGEDLETLFQKPEKIRGYLGPLTHVTQIDGETAYLNGFNAAAILKDNFIFGFYNLNLENNIFSNNDAYPENSIDFEDRGLLLGYIFMPQKAIHFSASLQAGRGNIEIYNEFWDEWTEDKNVFLLTPGIEAEFNITKFFRIGVGANYRFAMDVDQFADYDNKDFSAPGGFISLKFGWFK